MIDKISQLTEILPYVREFQGSTFVVKLGGEVLKSEYFEATAKALSLIQHIGIKVVVVHGGGVQLESLQRRLGLTPTVIAGRRVTDAETLNLAKMVYRGLLNTDLVAALNIEGARAIGLCGADGMLMKARKKAPQKIKSANGTYQQVDYGLVGEIEEIRTALLNLMLKEGFMPCVCALAIGEDGQMYNVNADTVASVIAQKLHAEKLILLSNVPGVLRDKAENHSLVSYTSISALGEMIKQEVIDGGMLPKVEACIAALRGGVPRTHIIDGTRPGSLLLELFLNSGCGTMIVNDEEAKRYEDEMRGA